MSRTWISWLGLLGLGALLLSGCAHGPSAREVDLIVDTLAIAPGVSVADVGAGAGGFSVALADRVGPSGTVYATELGGESLATLRAALQGTNVTVIEATPTSTGLPAGCCDAILLRGVYHHLIAPAETLASLNRALKPGGRLLVIDFPPSLWLAPWTPEGIPEDRGGHGIAASLVTREAEAAGFRRVRLIEDWPRGWFTDLYGLLLEKPAATGAN